MFHSDHLSQYSPIINAAVDGLIGTLSAIAKSGKEVDIMQHLGQMTIQVTGAAAFGYSPEATISCKDILTGQRRAVALGTLVLLCPVACISWL